MITMMIEDLILNSHCVWYNKINFNFTYNILIMLQKKTRSLVLPVTLKMMMILSTYLLPNNVNGMSFPVIVYFVHD